MGKIQLRFRALEYNSDACLTGFDDQETKSSTLAHKILQNLRWYKNRRPNQRLQIDEDSRLFILVDL